jgi:hypothetical protein
MVIVLMPHLETGSDKSKMAAAKPDVPVSHLLYKIAKKFQRLSACFRGRASQWRYREDSASKIAATYQHEFTIYAIWNKEYNI